MGQPSLPQGLHCIYSTLMLEELEPVAEGELLGRQRCSGMVDWSYWPNVPHWEVEVSTTDMSTFAHIKCPSLLCSPEALAPFLVRAL